MDYSTIKPTVIKEDFAAYSPIENFRRIFLPYSSHVFLHIDFSAQELRIPTFYANETVWLNALINDEDLHRASAAALFNKDPKDVTKAERQLAKVRSFALLYGSSGGSIQSAFNISKQEAEGHVARFHAGLPNLSLWFKEQERLLYERGYVQNAFGRRRNMLPWLQSPDKRDRGYSVRSSFNHPIQSLGGEIMRLLLSRVRLYRTKEPWCFADDDIIPLSSVYDELNLSVNPTIIPKAVAFLQWCMVFPLPGLPDWMVLKVDPSLGNSWGNTIDLSSSQYIPWFVQYHIEHVFISKKILAILLDLRQKYLSHQFPYDPSYLLTESHMAPSLYKTLSIHIPDSLRT